MGALVGFMECLLVVELAAESLVSASQLVQVWVLSLANVTTACLEGLMSVEVGVMSLGSFLCSDVARSRNSVTLRISTEVRSDVFGPGLSLLGSLAMMALVVLDVIGNFGRAVVLSSDEGTPFVDA